MKIWLIGQIDQIYLQVKFVCISTVMKICEHRNLPTIILKQHGTQLTSHTLLKKKCDNSVFARGLNSTMKRCRPLQWPESVLVSNPYCGTMLKHIKTFFIIFFFKLHSYRATFMLILSIPTKFLRLIRKGWRARAPNILHVY